jgi:hypothetical protein
VSAWISEQLESTLDWDPAPVGPSKLYRPVHWEIQVSLPPTLRGGRRSPATAHCVQTPESHVDLAPGHFAAAGGHEAAVANSGGVVDLPPCDGMELNAEAPDNNSG